MHSYEPSLNPIFRPLHHYKNLHHKQQNVNALPVLLDSHEEMGQSDVLSQVPWPSHELSRVEPGHEMVVVSKDTLNWGLVGDLQGLVDKIV